MEGKVALVTGGNRGIGLECVRQLAEKGYTTFLTSRNPEKTDQVIERLYKLPNVFYSQLDIIDKASIEFIAEHVKQEFGRLDVLINNAAINYDNYQDATNASLPQVCETIETNLMGTWAMCQVFIPMMRKQKYGRIVNVSSGSGALNGMSGGTPGYGISKAALNALTIKLGKELNGSGILVNAVCPG